MKWPDWEDGHGSVVGRPRRRAGANKHRALVAIPLAPTHRRVVRKQRAPRTVGDHERLVLAVLQDRPDTHVTDLADTAGLSTGQVRYSLGILRENRLAGCALVDRRTVWTATHA